MRTIRSGPTTPTPSLRPDHSPNYAAQGERDQEARSREIHALARCDHPNVLRYFSSWIDDGYLHLQTEYCPGGVRACVVLFGH